jgi:hypothetical protein
MALLIANDLPDGMFTEAASADCKAGQERAEREADAGEARHPSDAEADHDDDEEKELGASQVSNPVEDRGDDPSGGFDDYPDDQQTFEKRERYRFERAAIASQDRDGEHHDHDRQVLEDEDSDRDLAGRRVDARPVGEQLEDDRRAAQRDQVPGVYAETPFDPERSEKEGHQPNGGDDLEPPAEHDIATYPRQPLHAELYADREQQEDDAHLGGARDQVDVSHEAEGVRPDEDAGEEETHDRRESQPLTQVYNGRSDREDRDQPRRSRSSPSGTAARRLRSSRARLQSYGSDLPGVIAAASG